MRRLLPVVLLFSCYPSDPDYVTAGDGDDDAPRADPVPLRVATFNVALHGVEPGGILRKLGRTTNEHGQGIAAILQEVRPDVVLLNEVDWDADGEAARLLHDNFLNLSQGGREPLDYPYVYVAASNTGVASGQDLDGDGNIVLTPGSEAYGNDSFGFGEYEGQYSFVVFSTVPFNPERTFQTFLWTDMPDADIPPGHYSDDALEVLRLSSKNHVDLPVIVGEVDLHLLLSHPTPPGFDGPEDRNGRRNHDENRFWGDYVDGGAYFYDDQGTEGALASKLYVVMGDLNADPADGDSAPNAIGQLLDSPNFQDPAPASPGGAEQAGLQGEINDNHVGSPALDTADFEDDRVGNLRLDYVLPSPVMTVESTGVFWPREDEPGFEFVGTFPFPVSDHRLVWADLLVPQP